MPINFLSLPGYQVGQGLNFEPLSNALGDYATNQIKRRKVAVEEGEYDIKRREADAAYADRLQREAAWNSAFGNGNTPAWASSMPGGFVEAARIAGPQSGMPAIMNMLARHPDMELERRKTDADIALRRAQASQAYSHGRYYDAQTGAVRAGPGDPTAGYGIDENGNRVRTQSVVLGDSATDPGGVTTTHRDFGPSGVRATDVPGVVTSGSGRSDRFATERAAGQRAMDAETNANHRARAIEFIKNREFWTATHGRGPRAGMMYDNSGREVPVGPLSASGERTEQGNRILDLQMKQIEAAKDTLLKSGSISRSIVGGLDAGGDTPWGAAGRAVVGMAGAEKTAQAFKDYKEGVMSVVYAMSGKQTTNKETENFLSIYMPLPGDSDARVAMKHQRLDSFLKSLRGNVAKGMVYEDAERKAMIDATSGGAPTGKPPASGASDGWISMPDGTRIREKR